VKRSHYSPDHDLPEKEEAVISSPTVLSLHSEVICSSAAASADQQQLLRRATAAGWPTTRTSQNALQ